jgi:class 3 adenylate cyclase
VRDERRIATVLFADLVGFTTFSEAADPEQVKGLVDHCFAELCSDITAFGGKVDKIVGDAIVALFGVPVAHEDDAEHAVRTGLRMQETLARLREERAIDARLPRQRENGAVRRGGGP